MVDKETPFAGGKSLRYDWDNMEKMCEILGLETLEEFGQFFAESKFGLKHIRLMIWAGLQRENETVSMEEVKVLLNDFKGSSGLINLSNLLITAISASWGDQSEGEQEGEKKPPKRSKN